MEYEDKVRIAVETVKPWGDALASALKEGDAEVMKVAADLADRIYRVGLDARLARVARKEMTAKLWMSNPPVPRERTRDQVVMEIDANPQITELRRKEATAAAEHEALTILMSAFGSSVSLMRWQNGRESGK